jgi:AraC-like DNA-binding protein
MGLIIDRDVDVLGPARIHPIPAVVLPIETTTISLRVGRTVNRVDRSQLAIVPARCAHQMEVSTSGTVIVVTLLFDDSVRDAAVRDYAPYVDAAVLADVLSQPRLLPRTRWIDELIQRFIFEREVCGKPESRAARFLEAELTKELFFLGREHLAGLTRSSVVFEGDGIAVRARTWIEAHLFEPFKMVDLVRHCGASESTVLRAFQRELGVAPAVYARRRRLEEALQLLETGRYTVIETATRVGYDSPSAFAAAFRDQFGVSPSSVRGSAPDAVRLPAHGMPPVHTLERIPAGGRRKR